MTFTESLSTCFRKYNTFYGRASRSEFWWFQFFFHFLCFQSVVIGMASGNDILYTTVFLGLITPTVSVAFRRMQDTGRSGFYAFIPVLNIILACLPGDKKKNEYGEVPAR